jgi:parallel beta-helix repeat protein
LTGNHTLIDRRATGPVRWRRPNRKRLPALLAFTLSLVLVGSSTVLAAPSERAAPAHDSDTVLTTFTDISDSPFRVDIIWAAEQGIARGCTADRFCPKDHVTREQMASFLARAFRLPSTTRDYFSDDNGSMHEGAINRVAAAGIAGGCGGGRFCPRDLVTRDQMAALLARALGLPSAKDDYFIDAFSSPHRAAINRAAAAGITGGCGPERFCPIAPVTREQMAVFLRRSMVPTARVRPPPTLKECSISLQSLVDAAPSGATVTAPACTYRETVTIRKPLTVRTVGGKVDGQGVRAYGFAVSADDVTIDGFEVTGTTTPAQNGAVSVRSSNRFTLRNGYIHHTGGSCVSVVGGSGHRILDSELAYCAQQGYHLSSVRSTLVARNRIHHNNPNHQYDAGWEAGGGKAALVRGLTFDSNHSHSNNGPGLWCDVDCRDVTYRNNRVWNNTGPGIFFETSVGATITGNRVWANGYAWPYWGWGGGIVLSSSAGVTVTTNIVAWNADGISVISQSRGDNPGVRNNYVHDNVIIISPRSSDPSDKFMLAWQHDHPSGMFDSAANNRGANNRYWHSQPEPTWARFEWATPKSTLGDFNATPGEQNGRYLTTSEKDTILTQAGMPTSP